MADLVLYVNTASSAGGDGTTNDTSGANCAFATLNAAEASLPADIRAGTGTDQNVIIWCEGSAADTTGVNFTGTATDATHTITVQATPGATYGRHAGVWSTSKYRLSITAASGRAIYVTGDNYVNFIGLQIEVTSTSAISTVQLQPAGAASSLVVLDGCLIRSGSTGAVNNIYVTGGVVKIRNCVISGHPGGAGIYTSWGASNPTVTIENCTIVANATYGVSRSSGTVYVKNTYSGGNGTADYTGTITFTTSASSDATDRTDVTKSIAYTTDNFTNVTAGTLDLHLVAGASATLLSGGTDLSANFTTDIDGVTRPTGAGTWSIGADQLSSVSVSVSLSGIGGSGGIGTIGIGAGAKTLVSGLSCTTQQGSVQIRAGAGAPILGVQSAGQVGTASEKAGAGAAATGTEATAEPGTVAGQAGAVVAASGVQAVTEYGDVSASGTVAGGVDVSLPGIGLTAQLGTLTLECAASVPLSGVQASTAISALQTSASATIAAGGIGTTLYTGNLTCATGAVAVARHPNADFSTRPPGASFSGRTPAAGFTARPPTQSEVS